MAIKLTKDEKDFKTTDRHECEIFIEETKEAIHGEFEKCGQSGEVLIHVAAGFGEDIVPVGKAVIVTLRDGNDSQYRGSFAENGFFQKS